MPSDPAQDQDFLKAPRDQQIQYLVSVDQDFAKASTADQNAYLDHVTASTPQARSEGDPRALGPHPSTTSPLSHFLPDINQRVASTLRPVGHPMEFLRGVDQSVRDWQANKPTDGNWLTRGLGVLGKGIADTASDYWEHPGHLVGDIGVGAMLGAGTPAESPRPVEVGSTNGIPWGSGGKGPLALRGKMIPVEPPAQYSGTATATIPVRPSATAPIYEPRLPGVSARPSVERLSEPTSALQRASEPPAPATPSATQVKPSIGRINELNAKPVETGITLKERASTVTAGTAVPAGVKPVTTEIPEPIARKARELTHRLGKAVEGFDPTNPEHERLLNARREDLAEAANRARVDGRTNWKPGEFSRAGLGGKEASPVKAHVLSELFKRSPEGESDIEFELRRAPGDVPRARPKSLASKLPTPEEDARIRKMMVGREAAKKDMESSGR
jgi:hypothetical protein